MKDKHLGIISGILVIIAGAFILANNYHQSGRYIIKALAIATIISGLITIYKHYTKK